MTEEADVLMLMACGSCRGVLALEGEETPSGVVLRDGMPTCPTCGSGHFFPIAQEHRWYKRHVALRKVTA